MTFVMIFSLLTATFIISSLSILRMKKLIDYEALWSASWSCFQPIIHRSLVLSLTRQNNFETLNRILGSSKMENNLSDIVSRQDDTGTHALNIAVKNQNRDIVMLLFQCGARIEQDSHH